MAAVACAFMIAGSLVAFQGWPTLDVGGNNSSLRVNDMPRLAAPSAAARAAHERLGASRASHRIHASTILRVRRHAAVAPAVQRSPASSAPARPQQPHAPSAPSVTPKPTTLLHLPAATKPLQDAAQKVTTGLGDTTTQVTSDLGQGVSAVTDKLGSDVGQLSPPVGNVVTGLGQTVDGVVSGVGGLLGGVLKGLGGKPAPAPAP